MLILREIFFDCVSAVGRSQWSSGVPASFSSQNYFWKTWPARGVHPSALRPIRTDSSKLPRFTFLEPYGDKLVVQLKERVTRWWEWLFWGPESKNLVLMLCLVKGDYSGPRIKIPWMCFRQVPVPWAIILKTVIISCRSYNSENDAERNYKLFLVLSNQPRGFSAHLVRVTCQHLDPAIYQISPAVLDDRSAIIARCQFCCTMAELQNLD